MNPPRHDSAGDADPLGLLGVDPAEVPDASVVGSLVEVQALCERVELARVRFVAALDGRTIYAADGARTPGVWLSEHLGIARPHASALVRDGRALRHCPGVETAWEAGRLGAAKARPLLAAREVHPRLFAEHEAGLIDAIAPLSVAHATIVINRWKACTADLLDHERHAPDCPNRNGNEGGEERGEDGEDGATPCGDGCGQQPDPIEANRLHLSATTGGRYRGDLDLDAISGARLQGAIDAWIDARWRDGTFTTTDGLTPARRRALALIDLCCTNLPDTPDHDTDATDLGPNADPGTSPGPGPGPDGPTSNPPAAPTNPQEPTGPSGSPRTGPAPSTQTRHGEPRPSVSLLLDARTLLGHPIDSLEDLLARRCELDDGTPIPLPTAHRLLCNARIQQFLTRIATDGTIETLGVTDHLRDATRNQRRALRHRDRGCVFPGCTVGFDRCQIHHLTPHELAGPTLLSNLVALCNHHHHLVHEGRWRLWRTPHDDRLHLVKPDHTYVPIVGHGHTPQPHQPPGTGPPPPPPLPTHHRRTTKPPAGPTSTGPPGSGPPGPGAEDDGPTGASP